MFGTKSVATSPFGASFGSPTSASSSFGAPRTVPSSAFGSSTFGQPKPTTTLSAASADHSLERPQQQQEPSTSTGGTGAEGEPNATEELQSSSDQPVGPLLDPGDHVCLELLLRKLLLGEELVNTHFHLFSAKSSSIGQINKPRVIFANNDLLAKSSKYFLDMLSSDINPSDPSLSDLTGDNDVPDKVGIDEYGYASDSDLDECEDSIPEVSGDRSAIAPSKANTATRSKDEDELSDDGSESVSSDMFVMSPEEPRPVETLSMNLDAAVSVASSVTVVQGAGPSNKTSTNHAAIRLRSSGGRQILVKDTAFQTWYALLNYVSTGKANFLPLSSATSGVAPRRSLSSTSSLDEPMCSAKSMYRLASKVGLDRLRDEALTHIRNNLTEHNILKEISSSLVSRYPQLLEMELDVLYSHIASLPVTEKFPDLVRRIINKELPHGADIIIKIHEKFVRELRPTPPPTPPSRSPASRSPAPAKPAPVPAFERPIQVTQEMPKEKQNGINFGSTQQRKDLGAGGRYKIKK